MIPNPGKNEPLNYKSIIRTFPERKGPLTHLRFRSVYHQEDTGKSRDGRPACVLPALLRAPQGFSSPVCLPERMWLLAAAPRRARPHVPVLCNREGAVRINHRGGGARSSTANTFSSTPPSSCSVFLSNYGREQCFPVASMVLELHFMFMEFAFSVDS